VTVEGPAARLAAALATAGRVRVPLEQIQQHWVAAAPELVGSPNQLGDLAHALEALADAGNVVLPAKGSWDRGTRPPLPKFVTVEANRTAPTGTPWRTYPWCTQLGWASSLTKITPAQNTQLMALNTWLAKRTGDDIVPMRVRSAEVFGDEKALDSLIKTGLFGPGRITLDLLGCRRYPPPLTVTRSGEGPDILIVENSDAYWVALEAAVAADGPIGRVAFGSGRGFEQSIYALAEDPEPPKRLWYWGDLDPDGIAIPAQAAQVASTLGLPNLQPATALWAAMAALPGTDEGKVTWTTATGAWLGDELWTATSSVRTAGARVAQERLAPHVVADALEGLRA
jgi:hypothetical protein